MTDGSVVLHEDEYTRICHETLQEEYKRICGKSNPETEVERLIADMRNDKLPRNPEEAFAKLKGEDRLRIGSKVGWYYKDSLESWKRWEERLDMPGQVKAPLPENLPYQGILVPAPSMEIRSQALEANEAVVVQFSYPTEKCYPDSQWFSLTRLLDNPDLVEVIVY